MIWEFVEYENFWRRFDWDGLVFLLIMLRYNMDWLEFISLIFNGLYNSYMGQK